MRVQNPQNLTRQVNIFSEKSRDAFRKRLRAER